MIIKRLKLHKAKGILIKNGEEVVIFLDEDLSFESERKIINSLSLSVESNDFDYTFTNELKKFK